MKQLALSITGFAFLLLAFALAQPSAVAQVANSPIVPQVTPSAPYTITDLGTLGGSTTKGMGINEDGHIAGASQSGSYLYAFL